LLDVKECFDFRQITDVLHFVHRGVADTAESLYAKPGWALDRNVGNAKIGLARNSAFEAKELTGCALLTLSVATLV
jgi:hypothetical protein